MKYKWALNASHWKIRSRILCLMFSTPSVWFHAFVLFCFILFCFNQVEFCSSKTWSKSTMWPSLYLITICSMLKQFQARSFILLISQLASIITAVWVSRIANKFLGSTDVCKGGCYKPMVRGSIFKHMKLGTHEIFERLIFGESQIHLPVKDNVVVVFRIPTTLLTLSLPVYTCACLSFLIYKISLVIKQLLIMKLRELK